MTNLIIMSPKELSRAGIIRNLIDQRINGTEAAKQLRLSVRQVKRIKARVIKEGDKSVAHRSRGRIGNRRIDPRVIKKAKHYLESEYYDFQPTFAMEKLMEVHSLKLSTEKVRQIMIEMGLWKAKR